MSDLTEKLEKRAADLSAAIDKKRDSLGELILAGKDPNKVLDELARQEAEAAALSSALDKARAQAAQQSEADREAARKSAAAEIDRLNKQADSGLYEIVSALAALGAELQEHRAAGERVSDLRAAYKLDKPNLYNLHPVVTGRLTAAFELIDSAVKAFQDDQPELFGLPAKPTAQEMRIREEEHQVERAENYVQTVKQARAQGHNVPEALLETAQSNLDRARRRLAALKN